MSFFIIKTQKGELRRRGYSEEQIREMKPEDAHRALGLIGRGGGKLILHQGKNPLVLIGQTYNARIRS
jgi:hypothetical protein